MYSLRVLHRTDVSKTIILKVCLTTITPVLEYTVPMWQSIPDYLADVIESESVKMGILTVLFPVEESYMEALGQANLTTLQGRREDLCYKYNYGKDEI